MKNLVVLLMSVICLSTYASNEAQADAGTTNANSRLSEYKYAVLEALRDVQQNCTDLIGKSYTGNLVNTDIWEAASVQINEIGQQPLLTFTNNLTTKKTQRITIKTSADYKSILSVMREEFDSVTVNKGDLRNPKFVKQTQLRYREICEPRK